MNHRHSTIAVIAVIAAGALSLTGCGSTASLADTSNNREPARTVLDPAAAWQEYYEVTHPAPRPGVGVAVNEATPTIHSTQSEG